MDNACPRCGSEKMIPDLPLRVLTQGVVADVYVSGAPNAWLDKDVTSGGLTFRVCGECGHVEMHANNFRLLYEKYERSRQS